jgi:hypothetical protein
MVRADVASYVGQQVDVSTSRKVQTQVACLEVDRIIDSRDLRGAPQLLHEHSQKKMMDSRVPNDNGIHDFFTFGVTSCT